MTGALRLRGPTTIYGCRAILREHLAHLRRCGLRVGGAAQLWLVTGSPSGLRGMVETDANTETLRPWRTPGVAVVLVPKGEVEETCRWWVLHVDRRGRIVRHAESLTRRGMAAEERRR